MNIFDLELSDISNILNNTPLHSTESYGDSEWRRWRNNQNRNRRNNNYQQLMRNICQKEQFQSLQTNSSIITVSNNRKSNDTTSRISNDYEQWSEIVTNSNTPGYNNKKKINSISDPLAVRYTFSRLIQNLCNNVLIKMNYLFILLLTINIIRCTYFLLFTPFTSFSGSSMPSMYSCMLSINSA